MKGTTKTENRPPVRFSDTDASGPARSALLIMIGLSILLSLWSIRQENLVRISQDRYERQTRLLDQGTSGLASLQVTPSPPALAPARYLLTDSLYLARLAAAMENGTGRQSLLRRAGDEADRAAVARSHWGEAQLARAYIESLSHPDLEATELYALVRSYIDAPYIHDAGLWRLTRSLPYWDRFPRSTRHSIQRESIWFLCKSSGTVRRQLFELIRQSPAYRPIFIAYGKAGCRRN